MLAAFGLLCIFCGILVAKAEQTRLIILYSSSSTEARRAYRDGNLINAVLTCLTIFIWRCVYLGDSPMPEWSYLTFIGLGLYAVRRSHRALQITEFCLRVYYKSPAEFVGKK